ncbi:MAG: V-type ATP synthase subunit K [Planctomycetota bacterium]|jgi:V/A-type H+-transporting ATPase subunit K|nr:V-type ATP synthase subunit K [Planctomycetota bacterium]
MISYFAIETEVGRAVAGAILALVLGGVGSAWGISIAAAQGAGVLSEKPGLFGKVILLILLPGTQGLYGFVFAFMIASRTSLTENFVKATEILSVNHTGSALGVVGAALGLVLLFSAKNQGDTSAAAISLVAKKEDQFGRAIILPALVETYAVFGLLMSLLMLTWLLR